MRVIIAGKRFEVKTEITEFTIKDLLWANPLLTKVDYSFKWCLDWLLNASNIPMDYLERLDLEHDLKPICEVSVLGLRTPDTFLEQDFIKLEGKKYEKRKELETLSGMRIFLGNNNYKQFALMGQMHDILAKSKEVNPIALASINAVLYGDDFTDKAIEERTKLFMDLPLIVAYSGFFLCKKDLSRYNEFLLVSSEMKIRVVERLDKSFRILSSRIFGVRLLTRLQVRGFLMRLTKAL